MSVELFRILHSRDKVIHVEGRQAAVRKLLDMYSERVARHNGYGTPSIGALIERLFRSRRGVDPKPIQSSWGMVLEQFIDGEWVPVSVDLVPAHITLNGIVYKDPRDG